MLMMCMVACLALVLLPVNAQAATSAVKFSNKTATVYVGGSAALKTTGNVKGAKWTSSNKAVATVSSKGTITAKKAGKTVITVTVGKTKAKCAVTVKKALKAKAAVALVNKQIKAAKVINTKCYSKSIKASNLVFTVNADMKQKVKYSDLTKLGATKMYNMKNKLYWFNKTDKKWYYQTAKTVVKSPVSVISGTKYSLAGSTKFNGKKCISIKVDVDSEITYYYVDAATYQLKGISDGEFVTTVDMNSAVKVPSNVLKAKKKAYKL